MVRQAPLAVGDRVRCTPAHDAARGIIYGTIAAVIPVGGRCMSHPDALYAYDVEHARGTSVYCDPQVTLA